jgi:hypothetical protein
MRCAAELLACKPEPYGSNGIGIAPRSTRGLIDGCQVKGVLFRGHLGGVHTGQVGLVESLEIQEGSIPIPVFLKLATLSWLHES